MKRAKHIVFILAIAIVFNWGSFILESKGLNGYLRDNILVLLITLLAINTATISVVVTKLHEISLMTGVSFDKTVREVKFSLIEQIILIVISSVLLVCYHSSIIREKFTYHELFFDTLFLAVFIYAIDILRDTGVAIFDIIKFRK